MARADLKRRQYTIYAHHDKDLSRWKDRCPPTVSLNSWLVELIERGMDDEKIAARTKSGSNTDELNRLRRENLDLQQANERLMARLREAEEVYEKTAHTIHSPQLDRNVVDLLRSGGTWTSPKITEQLLTADKDTYKKFFTESHNELNKVDHAKSISRTLELLEQAGLVEQTARGWIWNK
jgi:hypothetical protein